MKVTKEGERRKEAGGERRYLFIFNLISFGLSHTDSVARKIFLDYLRTVVSPKSGVEISLSSPMVNKSKFRVVMSTGVFMSLASACRSINRRHNPHSSPKGHSKLVLVPCYQSVGTKSFQSEGSCWSESKYFPFTGTVPFFAHISQSACQRLQRVSAYFWINFILFILFTHTHCWLNILKIDTNSFWLYSRFLVNICLYVKKLWCEYVIV